MVGSGIIIFLCMSRLISFIMTSFSSSVVSFVRWPLLPRCLASLLSVRTVPSVRKSWGLQCVSVCQALRVRTVRSWSASTLLTEILIFSFKMSKTGLKRTSRYRWEHAHKSTTSESTCSVTDTEECQKSISAAASSGTHTHTHRPLLVCFCACLCVRCQQQRKMVSCSTTGTMSQSLWSSIRVMSGSHMTQGTNLPLLSTGKHTHTVVRRTTRHPWLMGGPSDSHEYA